jgi:hypothetical protein
MSDFGRACWVCRSTPADEHHEPCCSAHDKPLCCACYCRFHFVEVNPCCPKGHMIADVVSAWNAMDLPQHGTVRST